MNEPKFMFSDLNPLTLSSEVVGKGSYGTVYDNVTDIKKIYHKR